MVLTKKAAKTVFFPPLAKAVLTFLLTLSLLVCRSQVKFFHRMRRSKLPSRTLSLYDVAAVWMMSRLAFLVLQAVVPMLLALSGTLLVTVLIGRVAWVHLLFDLLSLWFPVEIN